ncbi:MAG TPA: TIGR01212 family radical SAM protein [Clostridiales bacterium UBA8960]|jgi:radical SAM protein (TIGR01212 family)|nr:TIGR01212 family radical SAM protein [Clostridiales bacterium UBA8960]
MKRYYSLSDYFKKTYGEKWIKLSVDGGFTCPNRDGTLSHQGCVFCSEEGSGEFAGLIQSGVKAFASNIEAQIESQKKLLSKKWNAESYIAYFQNYTNTYKPIEALDILYKEALGCAGIKGLVVSTRPDCVRAEHIDLFKHNHVLWVELGLQSVHDEKSEWLNRHYSYSDFKRAFDLLSVAGIQVVVHLIAGLPGEGKEDFLESVRTISTLKPFGVKFHMLNIVEGTEMARLFKIAHWPMLSESTYIEWICDAIEMLDPDIVIHRLTGDAHKSKLIEPKWILNKRSVLNGIDKCLVARNSKQGIKVLE